MGVWLAVLPFWSKQSHPWHLHVQASVAKHSPHLKKACVDAVSSHLTLGVMALNSEEELEAAQQAMLALGPELQRQGLAAPLELSLAGLSSFNDQVCAPSGQGRWQVAWHVFTQH